MFPGSCSQSHRGPIDRSFKPIVRAKSGRCPTTRRRGTFSLKFGRSGLRVCSGATSNGAVAYLILNPKQEYIYYRADGSAEQLRALGFEVDQLLAANDSVDAKLKVTVASSRLSMAEDKGSGAQLLTGKTIDGKGVALVVDKNGTFVGTRTQP